jgi:endonuclease-3
MRIDAAQTTKNELKDANLTERLETIADILIPLWPDARPLLHYGSCFELLCSVILSAQCTDEQVNAVTPTLFKAYPDARALAAAKVEDVEKIIHSVGFFHTKARNLIATARKIYQENAGEPPSTIEALIKLPGVGRKTANLVASACYDVPGVIVDTHVLRVSYRLGISTKKDPAWVEKLIRANFPQNRLTAFSHALNRHGKFVCTAGRPGCMAEGCPLQDICPKIGLANTRS